MEFLKHHLSYVWLLFCRCFSVCSSSTSEPPQIDYEAVSTSKPLGVNDDTVSPTATDGDPNTASSSTHFERFATATPAGRWTYDAFLSFRGEDTRKGFVDHLYTAMDRAGIYTFKDDEKLPRGKLISPELLKAIEESMVSVVVFSENYANSSWCLDELAKIIECHDLTGQRVLPVFYNVDPSDVRRQKGSFYTTFQQHEVKLKGNMEKVKRWREALTTAANLSGLDVPKTASGHEAECIKKIVSYILGYTEYHPTENLIGMESRVRDVKLLLGKRSGDVCRIGIWGMGGIGKTTLARTLFNQISRQFEGSSFVEDVRENGSDKIGLKSLQEKLLSEILIEEHVEVRDCYHGKSQIQKRLRHKKVLLVLDDVNDVKQLEFLAGGDEWFGPGSRILVTTRDRHVISCAQEKYAPELLNDTQAMKLFSRYAFKARIPPVGYEKPSIAVVRHTGGLPLALKVLGSHFCDRNLVFWQSALSVLAKVPNKEINGILKLSFDGLNDLEKKIFLDIACFFKGEKRDRVTRILDSFGFEPESGISILVEKSLLTVEEGNLHMHDLIQEMGQSIVRECNLYNRVWLDEEIKEVMTTTARLETVEAIVQQEYHSFQEPFNAEVFKSMKKLRLLQVIWEFTSSEPTYFPEQLQWLHWHYYPFESLKITRDMTKLVGLEMLRSCMVELRMEKKLILTNLKFINLRDSSIERFPDVSGIPNLKSLNLSRCESLVEVDQSVGLHKRIIHLDLSFCIQLEILPSSIQMESLKTLKLNGCCNLERFPEISGEMGRLLVLRLDNCDKITSLPSSIRLLTGLIFLILNKDDFDDVELQPGSKIIPHGFTRLTSLRVLHLETNNLVEDSFPSNLHDPWPSLEELNLSFNFFTRLPPTISRLSHLKYLNLCFCINLQELPELSPLLQVLKADHCSYLQKIGDLSNKYKWLFKISFQCCPKLLKDQDSQGHLINLLVKSLVQKCVAVNHHLSITVPVRKIPNWFTNQQLGNRIALNLPQNQIRETIGLVICCLFGSQHIISSWIDIKFKPIDKEELIDRSTHATKSGENVWIGYMSFDFLRNLHHDFGSEDIFISFSNRDGDVSECGVCVVYKDDVEPITTTGSCIQDYDELESFGHDYNYESASSEDLQHRRWSLPTFTFYYENTRDRKIVRVNLEVSSFRQGWP